MMNSKNHIALVIGATALFTGSANAHGYMTLPPCKLSGGGDPTKYPYLIDSTTLGWDGPFNQHPTVNTKNFWIGLNSSDYKDVRDLVNKVAKIDTPGATIECGICEEDAPPEPLPDMVEWTHSPEEGFTKSHEGPCLVYCDDVKVFEDDNCALHYPKAPALLPYDKVACEGASVLTFYWLALHTPSWQVYIACRLINGGKGGTTPKAKTPATTPSAYAPATPAPPAPPAPPSSYAPEPPTDAPTTPPADAPAPPTTPPAPPSAPPATPPVKSNNEKSNAKCVRHRRTRD